MFASKDAGPDMFSVSYQHTNYFLLPAGGGASLLAFDAGYPCSLYQYARELRAVGYGIANVKWAIVSHFHLDHAGLIGEFQAAGIACLLFENQGGGIDEMERIIHRNYKGYTPVDPTGFLKLTTAESRAFLASIGIGGEAIRTPGHSDDSVSLITDAGEALVGDLYPESQLMEDDEKSHRSWDMIRAAGGGRAFPSHAPAFDL